MLDPLPLEPASPGWNGHSRPSSNWPGLRTGSGQWMLRRGESLLDQNQTLQAMHQDGRAVLGLWQHRSLSCSMWGRCLDSCSDSLKTLQEQEASVGLSQREGLVFGKQDFLKLKSWQRRWQGKLAVFIWNLGRENQSPVFLFHKVCGSHLHYVLVRKPQTVKLKIFPIRFSCWKQSLEIPLLHNLASKDPTNINLPTRCSQVRTPSSSDLCNY